MIKATADLQYNVKISSYQMLKETTKTSSKPIKQRDKLSPLPTWVSNYN
jgi:hypothetical protein